MISINYAEIQPKEIFRVSQVTTDYMLGTGVDAPRHLALT